MTERQAAILITIIEQYAEVAVPVGSVTLAKLFGVSSATVRSEMAQPVSYTNLTLPTRGRV